MKHQKFPCLLLVALCPCLALGQSESRDPAVVEAHQKAFQRVFGDHARLQPAMIKSVLAASAGRRHYLDRNNDGKPEEVWFIDLDPRHNAIHRPILVRAIDEDGDLSMGGEPDKKNDLYVADWNADGNVDAVADYTDLDGDDDLDEMALYFGGGPWRSPSDSLMVWWGKDVGDDNLLWYDVDYTYRQIDTQHRTHFGGDEYFLSYELRPSDEAWVPWFENPFSFYDRDQDGVTEEVIRLEGRNNEVQTIRYSFDADNDGTLESPRDYDISISAHAPPGTRFDPRFGETRRLRGIPTLPNLRYDVAPSFVRSIRWDDMMLTWDEVDHNIDAQSNIDPAERWEGVICFGSEQFKQVNPREYAWVGSPRFAQIGGPGSGPVNKRYEVVQKPGRTMRVYYHPADRRIHLYDADVAWMIVDYNHDRKPDMTYRMLDTDGDGIIDTWTMDTNHDGQPEDTWKADPADARELLWDWAQINAFTEPAVRQSPAELFALDTQLEKAIQKTTPNAVEDPVFAYVRAGFGKDEVPEVPKELLVGAGSNTPELRQRYFHGWIRERSAKFSRSPETHRFYLDVIKDRLILSLKSSYKSAEFWEKFARARSKGDYGLMRRLVESEFQLGNPAEDYPAWITAVQKRFDRPRTGWAADWIPPNIGWESEKAAYRAYWGQFDFFGKKVSYDNNDFFFDHTLQRLILAGLHFHSPYHGGAEEDWGLDALKVGNSGGCGGITLYVNGQRYPVYCPRGEGAGEGEGKIKFTKRLISQSNDEVVIEMRAEGVGPKENLFNVRFRCRALGGHQESPIEVTIEGGQAADNVEMGIGLTRLPRESVLLNTDAGVFGIWGDQAPTIGTIGMGIIYPAEDFLRMASLPEEHQVIIKARRSQPITYFIYCDWLNGRQFPRTPSATDWLHELSRTAARVARKPK